MTDRDSPSACIEAYIDAYEEAQQRDGSADLARYLPERHHVHYRSILCELVRVDLEYSRLRGTPKGLDHYRDRFPELFDDAGCVEQITFEERRLRRFGWRPSALWAEIGGWTRPPMPERHESRGRGPPSGCGRP
jgi:hypothetical protein